MPLRVATYYWVAAVVLAFAIGAGVRTKDTPPLCVDSQPKPQEMDDAFGRFVSINNEES